MSKPPNKSKNAQKGRILEDVVALLHDDPDVVVQKRQQLPTINHPERTREVDVLVTGLMLGRQMRMAFECKNYGKRIGVDKIDEFRGKLEEVGIPSQYGFFVTVDDFTVDARQRAKDLGIRLLRLEGLTKERLSAEVHDAFQSLVYLMAVVTSVSITNNVAEASAMDMLWLRNRAGELAGGVPDLIWAAWRDGEVPLTLGEHHLEISLPKNWVWMVGGVPIESLAEATVEVRGVVATLTGQSNRFVLRDAETGNLDRARVSAIFEPPESGKVVLPVQTAHTEPELREILNKPGSARAQIGRIPLPRILYNNNIYWPPSLRVSLMLREMTADAVREGTWRPGMFESLSLAVIEGTDLSAIWEPVTPEHPAASDPHWPWTESRKRSPGKGPRVRPVRPNRLRDRQTGPTRN